MSTLSPSRALLALLAAACLACGSSTPSSPGGGSSDFDFEVRYLGTAPEGATAASFESAYTAIRAIVTGGLTLVSIPPSFTNLDQCDPVYAGFDDIPRTNISGVVVYIYVTSIDGAGGTLGSAGPCLVRSNNLTALGVMRLDEADVANLQASGNLPDVVLHELMHVLGFGTLWADAGLIDTTTASDARFVGAEATAACATLNGGSSVCATSVPVHSTDGAGSRNTHWRESVFGTELMTPFLAAGSNPLSATSIRSLADLGYQVSLARAQAFSVATASLRAGDTTTLQLRLSEPKAPRWRITVSGALEPFTPR